MTRGEGGGDNREKKGNGHQGTYKKDPWTKPKGGVGLRVGGGGGKWRQLYLKNNKKLT